MLNNQENKVYIGDLDKAQLLIMLYNNPKVQGSAEKEQAYNK